MKKLIALLSIMSLLLTGCGSWSPQSINGEDPEYDYEDEFYDYKDEDDDEDEYYDYEDESDEIDYVLDQCKDYEEQGYDSISECFHDNY